MIKKYSCIIILISLITTFVSCSKSDNATPNSMNATTADSSFSANTTTAGPVNGAFVISGNVTRSGIDYETISLIITNYNNTTGTFNINGSSVQASYTSAANIVSRASNGQIAITAATANSVQGNFYFTCSTGVNVTAGSFYATW